MSKKRVGIYIDEDVWKAGNEIAYEHRVSFSEHVEKLLSGSAKFDFKDGPKLVPGNEQLDRIESKLDLLIPRGTPIYGDGISEIGPARRKEVPIRSDDEVLAEAQKKLESIQASRFNPQPKNKDKKG